MESESYVQEKMLLWLLVKQKILSNERSVRRRMIAEALCHSSGAAGEYV